MMPKRVTWMVVGGALTLVARSRAEQAVADETRRLAERVPAPDLARLAATVVVAGRAAAVGGRMGYRAAVAGGRGAAVAANAATVAGRVVADGLSAGQQATRRLRAEVEATRSTWHHTAEQEERLLRADLAVLTGDPGGAIDALVDRRRDPTDGAVVARVPPAVPAGRPRVVVAGPPRPGRVQRSYRSP